MDEQKLIGEKEFEGMSGIFIAEYEIGNMILERIVVSNPAILAILKVTKLSLEAQEEAVFALVDRVEQWHSLEGEEQVDHIKAVLTQETIIEYLRSKDIIRDKCTMVQAGIDPEGSIVIEAYYVQMNREQRRLIEKTMTEKQKKEISEAVNILSGNDKIIDLATKKLEKLKAEDALDNLRFKRVPQRSKEWEKSPW